MKTFFQDRSMRERVLLLAFALVGLAWWAPVALGRLGVLRNQVIAFRTELETQRMWLSHRTEIEARAIAAGRTLDPTKTLDASQAYAELDRMATGLNPVIGAQRSEPSDRFALHIVQVTIRRADMKGLLGFYEQVNAKAPYLGVEQCALSIDRANPGMLSAVFRIYSIEALKPVN